MPTSAEQMALEVFELASSRAPAYRTILAEAKLAPQDVKTIEDFRRLMVLDKKSTFGRFPIEQLCLDGKVGSLASVLTSSGHSGLFAFGLSGLAAAEAVAGEIDAGLDLVFGVRSCPTLLINCLPMGVKIPTQLCTLAETSVRADMVVAIVKAFASQFGQIIIVGDAAFVKLALELGQRSGVEWQLYRVHVILGEETLAENARRYIHRLLGSPVGRVETGLVFSSMGIAEVGLNLFFEVPPAPSLINLRGVLHDHADLRRAVLGDRSGSWMPSLFTYDPRRILVEFVDDNRLVLTTLNPSQHIPLIRYAPSDHGRIVRLPPLVHPQLRALGCDIEMLEQIPIVAIEGRGQYALAGDRRVYPEAIKEGIYHDPELARLSTANFRLRSGETHAQIRVQLSPGVDEDNGLDRRFTDAIGLYADAPVQAICQSFATFGSGMNLDYERKFDYLGV